MPYDGSTVKEPAMQSQAKETSPSADARLRYRAVFVDGSKGPLFPTYADAEAWMKAREFRGERGAGSVVAS